MLERCVTCGKALLGAQHQRWLGLTARQWEYLRLFALGLKNQDIADKLFVSLKAVKWQVNEINKVIGTTTRPQLILKANELIRDKERCES
jgi:DNA-binding CsgD family transcriptional regulator